MNILKYGPLPVFTPVAVVVLYNFQPMCTRSVLVNFHPATECVHFLIIHPMELLLCGMNKAVELIPTHSQPLIRMQAFTCLVVHAAF